MSLRSTLWLGSWLLLPVAACGGMPAEAAGVSDIAGPRAPDTSKVVVQGESMLELLVGQESELTVRHFDNHGVPLAGQKVQFGLVGAAEGASLANLEVETNDQGYASTKLKVGGQVSSFQVRASAEQAKAGYFDVNVVDALARPTLVLGVAYDGQRAVESARISVIENMLCNQLQAKSAELVKVAYVLSDLQQLVNYAETVGVGRRYAVVAWGSDDTNSTLATGCFDLVVPQTDVPDVAKQLVIVQLQNLPLSLAEEYDVTLDLDMRVPLADLAARTSTLVAAALPAGATPQASYLLDQLALSTQLDFKAARTQLMLDARLEERLTASKHGALRFFEGVTSAVATWGMDCSLEAQLTPALGGKPSRVAVTSIVSILDGKTAREVDPAVVPMRGAAVLDASYDDGRAVLDIKSLQVPLGFGSYAADLLQAVLTPAVGNAPEAAVIPLNALQGCVELQALVDESPSAFPSLQSSQLKQACAAANQKLIDQVKADWVTLDTTRPALQLKGHVFAHDRDGNGSIDDLGPSPLAGDWATANGPSETTLNGTLRVTPKSLLTI
jgi:hypothetical protein